VFQVWNNIRIFIRGRYRTVDFIPLLLFSAWWKFHLLKWSSCKKRKTKMNLKVRIGPKLHILSIHLN